MAVKQRLWMMIIGCKMEIHGQMGSQCLNRGISTELEVETSSMLKWCVVLCHHSPRWIFLAFRQDPLYSRWQPLSIYVAPPSANPGNQHSWPHHSDNPLYFQPTFASFWAEPLVVISSAHPHQPSSIMSVHLRAGLTPWFLSFMSSSGMWWKKTRQWRFLIDTRCHSETIWVPPAETVFKTQFGSL